MLYHFFAAKLFGSDGWNWDKRGSTRWVQTVAYFCDKLQPPTYLISVSTDTKKPLLDDSRNLLDSCVTEWITNWEREAQLHDVNWQFYYIWLKLKFKQIELESWMTGWGRRVFAVIKTIWMDDLGRFSEFTGKLKMTFCSEFKDVRLYPFAKSSGNQDWMFWSDRDNLFVHHCKTFQNPLNSVMISGPLYLRASPRIQQLSCCYHPVT